MMKNGVNQKSVSYQAPNYDSYQGMGSIGETIKTVGMIALMGGLAYFGYKMILGFPEPRRKRSY